MPFTSHQKLFSFSRYLSFCLEVLVMQQNGLVRKIRLTSNFMTSQPGQQTIVIHILVNILRSKGSQTMKFAQLISSNMRNTLLSRSYTKCGGEASPRLFSEKLKLNISLIQQSKSFIQFVFIVCQVEGYENILKLSYRPLAFTSQQAFLKNKKMSGISLPCLFFCILFKEKYFSYCILLIDQVEILGNMSIAIFVNQVVTSLILNLTLSF